MLEKLKSKDWEISNSSLAKISTQEVTYEQCRDFSCNNIVENLTHMSSDLPFITEIPFGTKFNFLVRIDTNCFAYDPQYYYEAFEERDFISFSTIHNDNISHYNYQGRSVLFAYDIKPSSIVHVFPTDSDIDTHAKHEDELTNIPSLWLTLQELNAITLQLETYNQISCKTKEDGKILKPFAVIAFDKVDDYTESVAKKFGIGCIIVHPNKSAINNCSDLFSDYFQTKEISHKLHELYGINVSYHYYF